MENYKSNIQALMPLLVLGLLALCLLLVLLTGAGVYQNLTEQGALQHTARTGVQYLSTRLQQAQSVEIAPFGQGDALILHQEIDGDSYVTRVYCHDGWLRELFSPAGADLSPKDGEILLEAQELTLSLEGALLTARLDGQLLLFRLPTMEVVP